MKPTFYKGIVLGAAVSVLVLVASAAVAGTGVGGIFNLGVSNTVNGTSALSGVTPGAQLQVANTSTGATAQAITGTTNSPTAAAISGRNAGGGPAAAFSVLAGKPPFAVDSATKVNNLNADLLDGVDSAAFLRTNGTASNSAQLGGSPPTAFLRAQVPLALMGATGQPGLSAVNTGAGPGLSGRAAAYNGIQGFSESAGASGVYGENTTTGGYGVAGRSMGASGIGIFGDNTAGGWSGYFTGRVHLGGTLDCNGCVSTGDIAPGTAAPGGTGDWAVKHVQPYTELVYCSCGWAADGTYHSFAGAPADVSSLTLPQGVWHVDVFAMVYNHANASFSDNRRGVQCGLAFAGRNYSTHMFMAESGTETPASMRTVQIGPGGGTVVFQCLAFDSFSAHAGQTASVRVDSVNFEAFRLANYVPAS